MTADSREFVSRAGEKLQAALNAFCLDVRGLDCADFGCNVGGFTDCLLRRGAARVVAVDTGYGELAWKLRTDARVEVMERTTALHCQPPAGHVDLVAIDVAWTPQELIVPAAMKMITSLRRAVLEDLLAKRQSFIVSYLLSPLLQRMVRLTIIILITMSLRIDSLS